MGKMTARGGAKERDVVRVFREAGFPDAKRKAKTGARDEGDLDGIDGLTVEVKRPGPGQPLNLPGAVDEAMQERDHAGTPWGVAAVHRANASAEDTYAVMPLGEFARYHRERVDLERLASASNYLLAAAERAEQEANDSTLLHLAHAIKDARRLLREISPPTEGGEE